MRFKDKMDESVSMLKSVLGPQDTRLGIWGTEDCFIHQETVYGVGVGGVREEEYISITGQKCSIKNSPGHSGTLSWKNNHRSKMKMSSSFAAPHYPAGEWVSEVAQSCPTLCDPMDCTTYQAPPSMGFSRQEYWIGLPFPSPGDLPYPGIEPRSLAFQADALTFEPPGKPGR